MGQDPSHVPDAEWAVLEVLWEHGATSVRRLADFLYPGGGPSEYATVHKLLERLERRGHVARERQQGVFVFQACLQRDDLIGRQLEMLVEKMCGGSLQPLLTSLIRAKRLTSAELRELLALVDDLDSKSKSKRDRG
jgi:predicted transcriptional regulator